MNRRNLNNLFFLLTGFKEAVDFSLESSDGLSYEAVEDLVKQVIKYSPKTNHENFHSVLYAGFDYYGLSAAWIMDALNTIP